MRCKTVSLIQLKNPIFPAQNQYALLRTKSGAVSKPTPNQWQKRHASLTGGWESSHRNQFYVAFYNHLPKFQRESFHNKGPHCRV